MARCCWALAVVRISKVGASGPALGVRQVLRTMVASSAIRVAKLCAGVPSSSTWTGGLGLRRGRALGWRHRIARGLGGLLGVGEHQFAPGLAHVPLDVVRQHAQQDVRAHPIGQAMVDRPHLQVHRLDGAERPLHVGQRLVAAHALCGIHLRLGSEVRMTYSPSSAASRAMASVLRDQLSAASLDAQLEVLGHLVPVDDLAHLHADLVAAL